MAPPPEVPPAMPASLGIPLQPATPAHDDVPEVWLAETEHLEETERVDRLAHDYELITGLALAGFTGPRYDYFANELAKYAMAVLRGWLRRRLIFERCRNRGYRLPEPPTEAFDDPDVVDELVNETVAKALLHFRNDVLLTRRWDYRRGASLRTFFIGQCLMRFPNIYRAWWGHEIRRPKDLGDQSLLELLDRRQTPSVEQLVVDSELARIALQTVSNPVVREAILLRADGLSHADIAERLNCTTKTVERMLAHERDRMRKRGVA